MSDQLTDQEQARRVKLDRLIELGKRIRKMFYGKTRSEVAIKMTSALNESMVYGNVSFTNDTLQILMEEWLRVFKKAEVTTRTYEGAKLRAQNHIYPYMGGMKLRDVNTSTIQGLLNKMIFDGYALATIRKVKFLLNQFFNYAKKFKFVKENPVDECIVKSNSAHKEQKKEDYKAIPIEAREKFIEALNHNETMKPICMTLLFAGLRIGEALALKWKDVCFNDKTIIIDNAITEILEYDREDKIVGRKTVISDTKTAASVRVVPMPDVLVEILEQWKKRKEWLEKTTKISMTKPEDIVFSTDEGKLRTYYGTKSIFNRLMKQYGLDRYHFHFHTLRHTYATMLFEMEENPKIIQHLMGHSNVTTTIQTYNSVDKSYFKQATDKLTEQFKRY